MGAVLCGEWIQQVPAESQPTDRHSVAGDNVASQQLNSGGFWSGSGGRLLNHLPPSLCLSTRAPFFLLYLEHFTAWKPGDYGGESSSSPPPLWSFSSPTSSNMHTVSRRRAPVSKKKKRKRKCQKLPVDGSFELALENVDIIIQK